MNFNYNQDRTLYTKKENLQKELLREINRVEMGNYSSLVSSRDRLDKISSLKQELAETFREIAQKERKEQKRVESFKEARKRAEINYEREQLKERRDWEKHVLDRAGFAEKKMKENQGFYRQAEENWLRARNAQGGEMSEMLSLERDALKNKIYQRKDIHVKSNGDTMIVYNHEGTKYARTIPKDVMQFVADNPNQISELLQNACDSLTTDILTEEDTNRKIFLGNRK